MPLAGFRGRYLDIRNINGANGEVHLADSVAASNTPSEASRDGFIDIKGERFYKIGDLQKMAPFFISLISNNDHWLFASSNGGLAIFSIGKDLA